jgi:hypothetical protein
MKGISFDLQEKRGTAFNLVDSFATGECHKFRTDMLVRLLSTGCGDAGVLGIMGVGTSLLECFSTVERGLLFIQKQVGVHKPNSSGAELSDDANFNDILHSVQFVVKILGNAQNKSAQQTRKA